MILAAVCLSAGAHLSHAQALTDPMQPPSTLLPRSGPVPEPGVSEDTLHESSIVLQSTLVSSTRRVAIINGKAMRIGDRVGEARIVAISSSSVSLLEGGKTRLVELSPELQLGKAATSGAPSGPAVTSVGHKKGGDK